MPYTPPPRDNIGLVLRPGYTPPDRSAIILDMRETTIQVIASVKITWSITEAVIGAAVIEYGSAAEWLISACAAEYGVATGYVCRDIDVAYHGMIQGDCEITLPATSDVIGACQVVYGLGWEIVRGVELAWVHEVEISAAVDIPYSAISPVISSVEITYNLETMTPVLGAVELIALRAQEGETVSLSWALEVAGVDIQSVASISVARSMDQYAVSATVELLDGGDYLRCTLGAAALLTLNGEDVALIVTSRTHPRSHDDYRYQVQFSSPTVLLDAPWSDTISGDYYGMAADIADNVAAWPLTWSTVNWPIFEGRLQVSAQTPLTVLRQLAGAVGSIVVSEWDGDLTIEPEYPLSPSAYSSATPVYTVTEAGDVFTADESEAVEDYYNAVLIGDGQGEDGSSGNIHLDVIDAPDGDGKIVRGWCYPWNTSLTLSHAGGSSVHIANDGDAERDESEMITIVSGEGATRYPVEDVEEYGWQERSLGAITVDLEGKITAAVAGDSLLNITYTTRAREWRLRNSGDEDVLIIAEAVDGLSGSTAVSVLVVRGSGDSYGPEVQDPLITTDEAARERGRNLLDRYAARKANVQLTCPFRSLMRPGVLVEVLDLERPRWRGLLTGQTINIAVNGEDIIAETVLTIEQEVNA